MTQVRNLGLPGDMQDRVKLARIDDHNRQRLVATARTHIYKENCGVASAPVQSLLKGTSLHPNTVRIQLM
jgi:hypothetical protein